MPASAPGFALRAVRGLAPREKPLAMNAIADPSSSDAPETADAVSAPREEEGRRGSSTAQRAVLDMISPAEALAVNGVDDKTPAAQANTTTIIQERPSSSSNAWRLADKQEGSLGVLFDDTKQNEGTAIAQTAAPPSPSPSSATETLVCRSPHTVTPESSIVESSITQRMATGATAVARSRDADPASPSDDGGAIDALFSYFAIPGMYIEADTVIERHAVSMGFMEPAQGKRSRDALGAPASDTKAAASSAPPPHVHQLRPTQFVMHTPCGVCRRTVMDTEVRPPPSSSSGAALSFFSRLLVSPTSRSSTASQASSLEQEKQRLWTPSSTAASPAQRPSHGFGSEGYHCEMCGLALHWQCLGKLRETQACEVFAPAAHAMPMAEAGSDTASPADRADTSSGSPTWDNAKALLGSYLDPNGEADSCKDANVKFILSGVFALLDTVASRYPDLNPLTLVKRRQAIRDLSEAHQSLYAACTSSLQDSALLDAISWEAVHEQQRQRTTGAIEGEKHEQGGGKAAAWRRPSAPLCTREMRPLKVTTSLFSQLTSVLTSAVLGSANSLLPEFARQRAEDATGLAAASPVQLLLWRALRYAAAAYGEVYRRGSLSSTMSAALLFTVNRCSADVSKKANDEAVTSLLELPPSSLRLSRWAAKAIEPSYVLLVDHELGHIVVSFRGTLNTFDIMTDLAAVAVPFCGGYAHQGVVHVVNALFDYRSSQYGAKQPAAPPPRATASTTIPSPPSTSAVAENKGAEVKTERGDGGEVKVVLQPYSLQTCGTPDGLLDGLEQLAEEYPTYSILITGHSLGGGVAVLFAMRLHHDRVFAESLLRRIHVIAFAPMPTLSMPAASCFDAASCEPADGGFNHTPSTTAAPQLQREQPELRTGRFVEPTQQSTHNTHSGPTTSACDSSSVPVEPREGPCPACFSIWNVVSGFDWVPRVQVNTIDRLLRQVVGPQIKVSAATPSTGDQQKQPASRVTAATTRQRCCAQAHGSASAEADTDPGAVEMTDMPTRGAAQEAAEVRVSVEMNTAAAAPFTSSENEEKLNTPTEPRCSSPLPTNTRAAGGTTQAGGATVAKTSGSTNTTALASESMASLCTVKPATGETPVSDNMWCGRTRTNDDEPTCSGDARTELIVSGVEEEMVKGYSTSLKSEMAPLADAAPEAAAVTAVTAAAGSDEGISVTDATASHAGHDLSHELYHPGRVMLLTSPWDTTQNRLVDVPRGHPVMHELFLMKYMLLQHTVDAYCGSLAEVHRVRKKERHVDHTLGGRDKQSGGAP
ncbi:hypothetical protein ABL78_0995 [Leptomonas seymouri]|uniref:sn-1-specific diacylglycerol lipase n=1 Tax=Leptomonas seymouri TaxID=5684 RepID=A0A0N1I1C2_LEPSE|nr:hypothetical protein ABL78_0995 [Leptomonas seymouri]|eukprot:KPI89923.1 hypothetical protein ABL78_0995 [Leptomonas seymouri]